MRLGLRLLSRRMRRSPTLSLERWDVSDGTRNLSRTMFESKNTHVVKLVFEKKRQIQALRCKRLQTMDVLDIKD